MTYTTWGKSVSHYLFELTFRWFRVSPIAPPGLVLPLSLLVASKRKAFLWVTNEPSQSDRTKMSRWRSETKCWKCQVIARTQHKRPTNPILSIRNPEHCEGSSTETSCFMSSVRPPLTLGRRRSRSLLLDLKALEGWESPEAFGGFSRLSVGVALSFFSLSVGGCWKMGRRMGILGFVSSYCLGR